MTPKIFIDKSVAPKVSSPSICDGVHPMLRVPATVAFYMVASLTLVIVNKMVLNSDIKLPVSLLWTQTIVCVCLIWGLAVGKVVKAPTLNVRTCYEFLPFVCLNIITLCLNTFCLQYVDASVFQIVRGTTLPCTMLAQYLLNDKRSSGLSLIAATIITAGFLSGLLEKNKVGYGILFGFLSSVGAAIGACFAAKGLDIVGGNPVHLVYYNQTMLVFMLIPVWLLSGEVGLLGEVFGGVQGVPFIRGVLITGAFAFLINLAGFLQIKMTSPATHIVSGAVRGVLQSLLGVVVLGESLSKIRIAGTVMIIGGSSLYTYDKSLQ